MVSIHRWLLVLLALGLVFAAATLAAQHAGVSGLPPGFTPHPDSSAGPWTWRPAAELAVDNPEVWGEARAALDGGWLVMLHPVLRTPTWILTHGHDVGVAPLDESEASLRVARELALELREILGIDDPGSMVFHRSALTPNPSGQQILGVEFRQTYRGYDVRSATDHLRVKLIFNATLGRLAMIGSDWIPNLRCAVQPISRADAVQRARDEIPAFAPGQGRVFRIETYVLVGPNADTEIGLSTRLVHHVFFQIDEPANAWSVVLDANTGRVIRKHNERIHVDVTGTLAAGSWDDTPVTGAFMVMPMRSAYVDVVGGNRAVTDVNGVFKIAHAGATAVTIAGGFHGDWCSVQNKAGANLSFSQPATPGTAANVVLNPSHLGELTTAQATAYRFVNVTHALVAKRYPGYRGMPKLTTNVNIGASCNAFYQNASINFYTAGSAGGNSCPNTAYEEVIAHEYGHGFHVVFHGSYQPLSFSEGLSDHLGLYVSGQRGLGRDFYAKGKTLRDYATPVAQGGSGDRQWKDPACGAQSHCEGQAWAGCTVDLLDLLVARHGQTQGKDTAEIITIAQYSRNPADIKDAILQTFLQDDNDANLQNGTPNFKQIAQAADLHGIPRPPDPPTVQLAHTPLADTRDTVNPYRVTATVTSQAGNVTGATLYWSVGTGPVSSIVMTKVGVDLWAADIPARKAVAKVSYYLEGRDDKQNRERLPDPGVLQFTVGQIVTFFHDDFETDKGWTGVHTATGGRFHRADPLRMTWTGNPRGDCQPEDDTTPGAGVTCYVTENGLRGREEYLFDVDNGSTEIRSPIFDLSQAAAGAARVRYQRWFYTYNNDDDTLDVDLSADGGKTWAAIEQVRQNANQWTQAEYPLTGVYTRQMQLRFRTADNPNNSVTDACVDDVSVLLFTDDVAELTANTRAPAPGSALKFQLAAARRAGGAWYWAISLFPGPTTVPGVGRIDLGVPMHLLAAGVLDGAGHGAFSIPIPNIPGLRGTTFYTEALVLKGGAILSNPWNVKIQ